MSYHGIVSDEMFVLRVIINTFTALDYLRNIYILH